MDVEAAKTAFIPKASKNEAHQQYMRDFHLARRIALYIWALVAFGALVLTLSFPSFHVGSQIRKYIDPDNTRDWQGITNAGEIWSALFLMLGFPALLINILVISPSAGLKLLGYWALSGVVTFVVAVIYPATYSFSLSWGFYFMWTALASVLYVVATLNPHSVDAQRSREE